MRTVDQSGALAAALARAETQAHCNAVLLQHKAITATLAAQLRGLPRLRWSRPNGTGAAGIRGRADDTDLSRRVAAVAAYATEVGDKSLEVIVTSREAVTQTTVVLAGVPVTVEAVVWSRRRLRHRVTQAEAEDIVADVLTEVGGLAYVRRWTGTGWA